MKSAADNIGARLACNAAELVERLIKEGAADLTGPLAHMREEWTRLSSAIESLCGTAIES